MATGKHVVDSSSMNVVTVLLKEEEYNMHTNNPEI